MIKEHPSGEHMTPDMFKFVDTVLRTIRTKEVFQNFHTNPINMELYTSTINHIIQSKMAPADVHVLLAKHTEDLYNEKLKKKPDMLKIKEMRTISIACSDTLEVMGSYIAMLNVPNGPASISLVCALNGQDEDALDEGEEDE